MADPRAPRSTAASDPSASAAARRLGAAPAARGPLPERVTPAGNGTRGTGIAAGMTALRGRLDAALQVRDPLTVAVIASLVLHAMVLFVRFAPPLPLRIAPSDARLEVVLVNAQTPTRPSAPQVLAQVDLEGGGEHEQGRARSPLPAEATMRDGMTLEQRRRRVDELEVRQRELLALAKGPRAYVSPQPSADAARQPDGADREDLQAVITRMQAEIARNVEDYNKRPKRLTFGVNAVGVNYARYVADWATRIERIGTERYPPEARGRQYDSLIITVEIDKHGNVVDVVINKKSKYEALNRAVKQIVYAGQPYERFPPEMARDGDILQIVRTWTFTNDALETRSLRGDR